MADCLAGVVGAGRHARAAGRGQRDGVPARARLGRRRRPRRRAGRDRGRAVRRGRPGVRHSRRCDGRHAGSRLSGETGSSAGLTVPGLANCHSHAFHRALRGRTQRERGTFWTWREQMYAVAGRLDPDTYLDAGPGDLPRDGGRRDHRRRRVPLPAPPARRHAVRRPERDGPGAGRGGPGGRDPDRAARHLLPQRRVRRAARGRPGALQRRRRRRLGRAGRRPRGRATGAVVGAAIHSVRAVPARPARRRSAAGASGRPLHVHLSEQVAENDACLAAYGVTPTRLLADAGVARSD